VQFLNSNHPRFEEAGGKKQTRSTLAVGRWGLTKCGRDGEGGGANGGGGAGAGGGGGEGRGGGGGCGEGGRTAREVGSEKERGGKMGPGGVRVGGGGGDVWSYLGGIDVWWDGADN